MATPVTYTCVQCKEQKGQDGFYKKQWKLKGAGKCMCCWDDEVRKKQKLHNEAKSEEDRAKKMAKVERECATCKATFVTSQSNKGMECSTCEEKTLQERLDEKKAEEKAAEQKRLKKQKADYYMIPGIGYEDPGDDLQFKTDISEESLFGNYKLVFYVSHRPCPRDDKLYEYVHRTAKGKMEILSGKKWNGKPAIYGRYSVDCKKLGEHTSGSFIEHVTDCNPSRVFGGGFNIFDWNDEDCEDKDSPDYKKFIVNSQGGYSEKYDWWSDLHEIEEADDCYFAELCAGVLKVVGEKKALGLAPDKLSGIDFFPEKVTHIEIADNKEHAKELMAKYGQGSNSYICQHFDLPDKAAFNIREFVTPPPCFYVEKDDLVMEVEESEECEWMIRMIFRKTE